MTDSLGKLKAALPDAPEELLAVLLEDAEASVKVMTRLSDVSGYEPGVRAVAVLLYNRMGREGELSHGAGGVTVSYGELPQAVKHLLPLPLASIGGRKKADVAAESQI